MAIYESLNTIQTKLKAPKGQNNDFGHYKYRSCEDILKAVKSLLDETKTTLILNDDIVQVGTRYYIKATATLTDGTEHVSVSAFAREQESKKGMDEAQVTGATSSYARKYALCGLFAIDGEDDQDTMDNRQEGVKNRLANRSSGTSNAAKGNYTQAGVKHEKTPPQQAQPKKTPTTVRDYYELTVDWAREHKAVAFIGPLITEKFNKHKFETLTLPEAKAFYDNIESLVKEAQAKDDEILEKSMA